MYTVYNRRSSSNQPVQYVIFDNTLLNPVSVCTTDVYYNLPSDYIPGWFKTTKIAFRDKMLQVWRSEQYKTIGDIMVEYPEILTLNIHKNPFENPSIT